MEIFRDLAGVPNKERRRCLECKWKQQDKEARTARPASPFDIRIRQRNRCGKERHHFKDIRNGWMVERNDPRPKVEEMKKKNDEQRGCLDSLNPNRWPEEGDSVQDDDDTIEDRQHDCRYFYNAQNIHGSFLETAQKPTSPSF